MNHTASTQLWVGPAAAAREQLVRDLQKIYCAEKGCAFCVVCSAIRNDQHYAFLSVKVSKTTYTRADFDEVFEKIILVRESTQPLFCFIPEAERLSPAVANSLLKVLEEPPVGWHWILTTQRPAELLPTVRSRCLVTLLAQGVTPHSFQPIYEALTAQWNNDIGSFHQLIDRSKISEQEVRILYDHLIIFWAEKSKNDQLAGAVLETLMRVADYPAMPGSSKLWLRTLYLMLSCVIP